MKRSPKLTEKPQAHAWLIGHPGARVLFDAVRRTLVSNYVADNHGFINLARYVEYRFNNPGGDYTTIVGRLGKVLVTFNLASGKKEFSIERKSDTTQLLTFLGKTPVANFINPKSKVSGSPSPEDDEIGMGVEDLRKLRTHKAIERNGSLAKKAKKALGYVCMSCTFDFSKRYVGIGKNFIEAHHLTPLSKLKGQKVALNPKKDFAVLCSNCHRMIHKTLFVGNIEKFRKSHVVGDSD